ncbi:FecCD family ABC transporter permease [Corynebacterium flavescens]|uniref:FecCD family ABC transporter permease n=1 Tax=Corynebacterium flavescens TaxID=28028 RepID=UPI000EEBD87D|nr:iron ABC transporter permease [Corynebacterium flavescens]MDN6099565.1 iron ABC transporter permease [Corynebacterium flavescens]MDN6199232.1 iron ABC transporter permease [Corynebacterium flavescens]MDN6236814.1 iron ABC transporter permease [Corynebacterium flavescens]MDN6430698.1 iron ABC transporter permease [Corynebacterium flavescens]MDN6474491.1 iron ABC transporter permease [Corynebacterium flavescens]
MVASVMCGVRTISVSDAVSALGGSTASAGEAAAYLRVPRTVLALFVGAALALAGTTFQAMTRNPLADPGIFGVLSGASLAVVVGIAFFGLSRPVPTMIAAIVGSFAAAVFVYFVGSLGRGGATPLKLALAGAATAAACSSLVSAVLLPRADVMDEFRFWQIGSVGGAQWDLIGMAAPLLVLGTLIVLACSTGLNALALGDDVATGLGINVLRTRVLSAVGAVILCGTATALAGPIAFVGLIVPHVMRLLLGTDHRWLLPATALAGALLLVSADTLGRVVARPSEVAVGILTPLIGAPLFIWIVRRTKVREL